MGIAYDGGALCHAVTYGIVETNLVQEFLHLRVEGGSSKDNFLKLAAKGVGELRAELLLNGGAQDGDAPVVLGFVNERLELTLVHFLHYQRHCYDDVRMDVLECLHDDFGAGDAGQEVHVHAYCHLKQEFEHHAVHVGRWQHAHNVHPRLQHGAGVLCGKLYIGIEGPVGQHYALGEARRSGSIVDYGKFLCGIFIIIEVLLAEGIGIALAEFLIKMLPHV